MGHSQTKRKDDRETAKPRETERDGERHTWDGGEGIGSDRERESESERERGSIGAKGDNRPCVQERNVGIFVGASTMGCDQSYRCPRQIPREIAARAHGATEGTRSVVQKRSHANPRILREKSRSTMG